MDKQGVLDTNGLMEYLRIGRNQAYALMQTKGFPAIRMSARRVVVPIKALEQWLDEQANGAMPERGRDGEP